MIRPPEEQEAYVRSIGEKFSTGTRLWAVECGTWQALYQEIYEAMQLTRQRIEQLENSESFPVHTATTDEF